MLFFEFFPAFMMLVSIVAGVFLYLTDRQAQSGPHPEPLRQRIPPPNAGRAHADDRGAGRPVFRA